MSISGFINRKILILEKNQSHDALDRDHTNK